MIVQTKNFTDIPLKTNVTATWVYGDRLWSELFQRDSEEGTKLFNKEAGLKKKTHQNIEIRYAEEYDVTYTYVWMTPHKKV